MASRARSQSLPVTALCQGGPARPPVSRVLGVCDGATVSASHKTDLVYLYFLPYTDPLSGVCFIPLVPMYLETFET